MSAYRENETTMNDQDCLVNSLKEMKYKGVKEGTQVNPQVHAEATNLEGYHGDKRDQKAEIIIKRKEVGASSNDIGFKKGEDGNFKAIISAFDSGFYNSSWMTELKKKYAEKKARKVARNSGITFLNRSVTPAGKIRLQFKVGM